VHFDVAGPSNGVQYLLIIDAFSKWPKIEIFKKPLTSRSTIWVFEKLFALYGLASMLVSDNASILKSAEFIAFCKEHGIDLRTSAEYHPFSNG